MTSEVSAEAVRWAYRLFLGREAGPGDDVEAKAKLTGLAEVRRAFLQSDEFLKAVAPGIRRASVTGMEPPMVVEDAPSELELVQLFDHIADTWRQLGDTEPHWSVLSMEKYRQSNIGRTVDAFYQSGEPSAELLYRAAKRNGVELRFESCLEYGCGVGRVTSWLAKKFQRVHGYDISPTHLREGARALATMGVQNVSWHHVKNVEEIIAGFPPSDAFFTLIVLQHNPPPIIALVLRHLLRSLNPGGLGLFQLPTYKQAYSFRMADYLRTAEARKGVIEMHALPQKRIFDIVSEEGCDVIEAMEDSWAGMTLGDVSTSFFVRRPKTSSTES